MKKPIMFMGFISLFVGITVTGLFFTACEPAADSSTPNAAPGAPTISSTTAGPEEVSIIWEVPADTGYINNDGTTGFITKYKVYYSTRTGFDISAAEGSQETTQTVFTISGLTVGTPYYFRVTAINDTGESPPSAEENATPENFTQAHTQETVTLADGSTTSVWTLTSNTDFVHVEGGTYWMGSQKTDTNGQNYDADGDSDESPIHEVTLSSYYISKYEVTQAQYNAVMGTNPSRFSGDTNPVEQVSWYDAVTYCNQLSENEGKEKVYTINGTSVTADWTKNGYRLPTEAEWEYAARGGQNSKGYKYSGSNTVGDVAWYSFNSSSQTQQVGTKSPNELGLQDMNGNVWEWCGDWYSRYESVLQTDPTGPSKGSDRVLRGGSWYSGSRGVRVVNRIIISPGYSNHFIGFRPVLPAVE